MMPGGRIVEEVEPDDAALSIIMLTAAGVDDYLRKGVGTAIMLDKPIILIAYDGVPVPSKLRQVADEVVEMSWDDGEVARRIAVERAILRVLAKFP